MAKAYVSDIAHFLNAANKENKRILDTTNLIWEYLKFRKLKKWKLNYIIFINDS